MAREPLSQLRENSQSADDAVEEHERDPDRSLLPSTLDAPRVAQWPPARALARDILPGRIGKIRDLFRYPRGRKQRQGHNSPPFSPQTVGFSFLGADISVSGQFPPDPMAAVSPTQILMCVNGRIRVFDKNGATGGLDTTTNNFFTSVRNGVIAFDPRVRFDRLSNRWFVTMSSGTSAGFSNSILLAVSDGPTIADETNFTFFQFQFDLIGPTPNADTGDTLDSDSLAVDANAVYIGVNVFNPLYFGSTGFVIRKSSILGSGPMVITAFRQMATLTTQGPYGPSGVDNDDPAATEGYFVGVDGTVLPRLAIRRVLDPGGTPALGPNLFVTLPTVAYPINTPCKDSGTLGGFDDRHSSATLHLDRISGERTMWLAQNLEVDSIGVGDSLGGRNGSRWHQIGSLTTTPVLLQTGTLFDSALTDPRSFWMPSVAMSGQGHMALGCSVAGNTEYAEIAVAGRLRTDPLGTQQPPLTVQTSSTAYNLQSTATQRWGDYSYTLVDPADDQTIWTVQEYCNATDSWGVRIIKLVAPPPATPLSCSPASATPGATNLNVVVTGDGSGNGEFFDTDASYVNRLTAAVSGVGVTVNQVTWNSPNQITLNINVSTSAPIGGRTITVTNPDGQSAASTSNIFAVAGGGCIAPTIVSQPANRTVCPGSPVSFSLTAGGTAPFTYQWRKGGTNVSGATSATYAIAAAVVGNAGNYDCVVTNACGSVTSNAATLVVQTLVGDLNLDGRVDLSDVSILLSHFGAINPTPAQGDLNGDHFINLSDLALMLSGYGTNCP